MFPHQYDGWIKLDDQVVFDKPEQNFQKLNLPQNYIQTVDITGVYCSEEIFDRLLMEIYFQLGDLKKLQLVNPIDIAETNMQSALNFLEISKNI